MAARSGTEVVAGVIGISWTWGAPIVRITTPALCTSHIGVLTSPSCPGPSPESVTARRKNLLVRPPFAKRSRCSHATVGKLYRVLLLHVAGACPTSFLNARLKAASDS